MKRDLIHALLWLAAVGAVVATVHGALWIGNRWRIFWEYR